MTQLNFKKMYLISSEKFDVLKTMSMQNNNNSSISAKIETSHNVDPQNIITPTRQNSNKRKRKISNSNEGNIVEKKRKILKSGVEEVPVIQSMECSNFCYERQQKCLPINDNESSNERDINTNPNTYKINKSTQTGLVYNSKTKPHFRRTFTRTFKSKEGNLEKTKFNQNGKRDIKTLNVEVNEEFRPPNAKKKRYASRIMLSKMKTNKPVMSRKINLVNKILSRYKQKKRQKCDRWLKLI